jgi:hypothetical protein
VEFGEGGQSHRIGIFRLGFLVLRWHFGWVLGFPSSIASFSRFCSIRVSRSLESSHSVLAPFASNECDSMLEAIPSTSCGYCATFPSFLRSHVCINSPDSDSFSSAPNTELLWLFTHRSLLAAVREAGTPPHPVFILWGCAASTARRRVSAIVSTTGGPRLLWSREVLNGNGLGRLC